MRGRNIAVKLLHVFWTIAHVFVKWKVGAFTLE